MSIKVINKNGKLTIPPSFQKRGIYFYFIPEKYLPRVVEGEKYVFKFGKPRDTGKKDKRGIPIFQCAAIPQGKKEYLLKVQEKDKVRTICPECKKSNTFKQSKDTEYLYICYSCGFEVEHEDFDTVEV